MSIRLELPGYVAGPVAGLFCRLYEQLSENPLPAALAGQSEALRPLLGLLYQPGAAPALDPVAALPSERVVSRGKRVLVGFSGGKDSVAAAVRLQRRGYEPILFHVAGLNRYAASEEERATRAVAGALRLPARILRLRQLGKMGWRENPARNVLVLGLMADYGLRQGISRYALGNFDDYHLRPGEVTAGPSDTLEVLEATAAVLAKVAPAYRLATVLHDNTDSMVEVMTHARAALPAISSCLMPLRYRAAHRKRISHKYSYVLLPGRCGICSKCASEYLHLVAAQQTTEIAAYAADCQNALWRDYERDYLGYDHHVVEREVAVRFFCNPEELPALARWLN